MKRPNRYPYTRSQWVEETVNHYTYKNDICYTSHILENRLTGEIKGRVVHKEKIGELYTITIQNYGIFVVTKDVYEKVKVGNEVIT